ncbi:hypothetical protein DUI87_00799 [Hirundo rustica rustica]|uniref:Uncharacterized protein n=1 Tax=Hirundo rustica rustica TaxID=333673 RepID=A0A3M0L7I3_HIRRU|nr:hypothetical protein DUI87_00799 [Hirundo rustica rustica]
MRRITHPLTQLDNQESTQQQKEERSPERRVGTPGEKAIYLAEAMVVALKPLVQQGKGDSSLKCFNCGKSGRFKAQSKNNSDIYWFPEKL